MAIKYSNKQRWPGGYIHLQQDGEPLFILERRVSKHRFHVSTRCHSWTAAMKQLERFESDPLNYRPEGVAPEKPIHLTKALALAYRDWQVDVRGTTQKHANEMGNRLADWMEDLNGVDLRKATLRDHIKPALDRRKKCRAHRIIALKGFYGWLRKEKHLLTSGQDATLDLPVPQAVPEKWKRRKAVAFEDVKVAVAELEPVYRDVMTLLAGTGWHVTEVERFIRQPESDIVYQRRGSTIATLVTRHKVGEFTRTPVTDPNVLAAAERLRKRKVVPRRLNQALAKACKKVKVPTFTAGVMRHSVGTWAVELGTDPMNVSLFLNHKDPKTTKRFYIDVAVPTTQVALPRLRVIEGGKRSRKKKTG